MSGLDMFESDGLMKNCISLFRNPDIVLGAKYK
jgi:hypothetical protein